MRTSRPLLLRIGGYRWYLQQPTKRQNCFTLRLSPGKFFTSVSRSVLPGLKSISSVNGLVGITLTDELSREFIVNK